MPLPMPPYASKFYAPCSIQSDPLYTHSTQSNPLGVHHGESILQWIFQQTDVCVQWPHPNSSQLQQAPSQSRWRSRRHWPEWASFDATPAWKPMLKRRPRHEWPNNNEDEVAGGMVDKVVDEVVDEMVDEMIGSGHSATGTDR